jgi:hypothetical protein
MLRVLLGSRFAFRRPKSTPASQQVIHKSLFVHSTLSFRAAAMRNRLLCIDETVPDTFSNPLRMPARIPV